MRKTFEVQNIRCGGCANTIKDALEKAGFEEVDVDLACEPRKVTVTFANEALEAQVIATLRKLGYPLVGEEVGVWGATSLKAKSFVSCAVGKFSDRD